MSLEMIFSRETLFAIKARVGCLFRMLRAHVSGESTLLSKASETILAGEGFLPGVQTHMFLKVDSLTESLVTGAANIWPLICMRSEMSAKVPARAEPLGTNWAVVWLLVVIGGHHVTSYH